jgi:hypothetical protein
MNAATLNSTKFIRYLWIVAGEKPIEMAGEFTEKRWLEFCKRPHPLRRDVTIMRLPNGD